jgi:hypothetical protein
MTSSTKVQKTDNGKPTMSLTTLRLLVKGTQEATLDSAFLVMASNMSALKARSMKTTAGAFDVEDFIEKLVSFLGGNQTTAEPVEEGVEVDDTIPLKWDKIGRKALAKSRRVPVMDLM